MALGTVALIVGISVNLLVEVRGQQMAEVTYDEIRILNATCGLDHSCDGRQRQWDNLNASKCVCGPECVRYNTCCLDSSYRMQSIRTTSAMNSPVKCVDLPFLKIPNFMIATCSPRWRGRRTVVRMCHQDYGSVVPRDPYVAIPVVGIRSATHYKNYFCGLCNNQRSLMFWNVSINVVEDGTGQTYDRETFIQRLYYDDLRKMWGFMDNVNGTLFFQEVKLDVSFDGYTGTNCLTDLISDCDPAWTEQTVRDKCRAYMAAIYYYPKSRPDKSQGFRNVHCAICNNVDLEDAEFKCHGISKPPGDSLSFSMLVDVDRQEEAVGGEVTTCKSGEHYDIFAKKCRAFECGLPGYIIMYDQCMRA